MGVFLKYIGVGGAVALLTFLFIFFVKKPEPQPQSEEIVQPKAYLEAKLPNNGTQPEEKTAKKKELLHVPASSPTPPLKQKTEPKNIPLLIPQALPKIEVPRDEQVATSTIEVSSPETSPISLLPPLDEAAILRAVVKIECPTERGLGKYIGSGFVLKGGVVVTAAHVIMDSGSDVCTVIFSRDRRPIYYLRGSIDNRVEAKRRLEEDGIDVAVLKLPLLESYPEAAAIFSEYPYVPYSFCGDPRMLGDSVIHFGYPANYVDQNYLSRLEGEAVAYADIQGVKMQLSEDEREAYKAPDLSFTADESKLHSYMVSRTGVFYGDSGGPAFNATKQCILGPHHGFARAGSQSYSVFMVLGWAPLEAVVPRHPLNTHKLIDRFADVVQEREKILENFFVRGF